MANFDWEKFFDGCVSADFGQFGSRLVWVYEHQPHNPKVQKHGYVHVTHKVFFADKGHDGLPEFSPSIPAPENHQGIAPFVVDPAGEMFMLNIPSINDDPGREPWVSGEMPNRAASTDKKSAERGAEREAAAKKTSIEKPKERSNERTPWGFAKVFKDVFKTAAAHDFPPHIMDQWKALQHMHASFSSETLPDTPFHISPPAGQALTEEADFPIDGQPVAWAELWRVLGYRFPRAHSQQVTTQLSGGTTKQQRDDGAVMRTKKSKHHAVVSEETLAVHNGVTSINHRPKYLARARKVMEQHNALAALPKTMLHVSKGSLYFIRTSALEGEMKVGLAECIEDADLASAPAAQFKWFVRHQWIHGRKHEWGVTPRFCKAGDPSKGNRGEYITVEELQDVCPVPVKCVPQRKQQNVDPKLTKACVHMLRTWCGVIKNSAIKGSKGEVFCLFRFEVK